MEAKRLQQLKDILQARNVAQPDHGTGEHGKSTMAHRANSGLQQPVATLASAGGSNPAQRRQRQVVALSANVDGPSPAATASASRTAAPRQALQRTAPSKRHPPSSAGRPPVHAGGKRSKSTSSKLAQQQQQQRQRLAVAGNASELFTGEGVGQTLWPHGAVGQQLPHHSPTAATAGHAQESAAGQQGPLLPVATGWRSEG
jgi:hypothetical protein